MKKKNWNIHKFGGSSLANANCFLQVRDIILNQDFSKNQGVVVSAVGGITDKLLSLCSLAREEKSFHENLQEIRNIHFNIIKDLKVDSSLESIIQKDLDKIKIMLEAISFIKVEDNMDEVISSFGELWSAQILNSLLRKEALDFSFLNAREFLIVKERNKDQKFLGKKSQELFLNKIENVNNFVATGYVASLENKKPTTLKRNGSDYSAALIAQISEATQLTIWTDVCGVLCADPRIVKDAEIVRNLTYDEVLELAYFGAKVIHQKAINPLIKNQIPLLIKNTFHPDDPGTLIQKEGRNGKLVKGFSSIDEVSLINVEGKGLVGVSGVAGKMFSALKQENISVILISQSSSEYSICFAVKTASALLAKEILENEFFSEIKKGLIKDVQVISDCSIIAVVGDNMNSQAGVSGKVFSTLGSSNVNIKAIAQGSSERNISFVIDRKDRDKALNSLYYGLYKNKPEISVGIIGPGLIGKTLIKQIEEVKNSLSCNLNIKAIMNSKNMWLGSNLTNDTLKEEGENKDLEKFKNHLSLNGPKVIIDCTSSEKIAALYQDLLNQGFHVITPNKKANCFKMEDYTKLKTSASKYFYETTVGAGLPIISTLKELLDSGDTVLNIQGVLSGTLSYIFNNLTDQTSFSEVVLKAKDNGFTEPDPRDDLNGMDVARKILILAREAGDSLELSDLNVENLVSKKELLDVSLPDFLSRLDQLNAFIQVKQKEDLNKKLRYIAEYDKEKGVSIGLQAVDLSSPFYSLSGADNMVIIKTRRYRENPLVIRGPGAGAEVTAAGVLGDLIKLTKKIKGVK